ncbi:hypothetical protein QR680_001667 [Steinernema hermaphroditum]|uniref:TIL domain-containing protein n=1 Tax=Steinernema hermaphroditum TaxID=289476 RepID=A0AA39H243_9BILA|nr:hypothetical protein QR680_001667 [Steinernema hermaphroditum]
MSGSTVFFGFVLIIAVFGLVCAQDCNTNGDCSDGDQCVGRQCVMLPSLTCPKGMHYERCGSSCPADCEQKQPQLCPDICVEGCFCDAGLVLNDEGQCIPKDQCPSVKAEIVKRETKERKQDPRCPSKAEYRECTNLCPEKHCGNILEKSTCFSLRCGEPGCMCVEGHVRKTTNIKDGCVRRETCLADARQKKVQKRQGFLDAPVPVCRENEELKSCGTACEPSCENPEPKVCTYQCVINQCECKYGLLRHKNGSCVPREMCH